MEDYKGRGEGLREDWSKERQQGKVGGNLDRSKEEGAEDNREGGHKQTGGSGR